MGDAVVTPMALLSLCAITLVALPLAGGVLTFVVGRRAIPWVPAVTAGGSIAAAVGLATFVARDGPQRLAIGGWGAPLGIDLYADGLTVLMVAMSVGVGALVSVFAVSYFHRADGRQTATFWSLWLILWSALHATFLAADVFNLYVTLEMLTFAAVALVALAGGRRALGAALRYLFAALFGSLAYLLGVAVLYGSHATLDIAQLGARMASTPAAWMALALMTAGLLFKTALVPFHVWLPPAHANAAAPVSALLSALVVKASFYLLLRLWFEVFPVLSASAAAQVLGCLGAVAIAWGSVQALRQVRLKMLVAYSTVAQLGYLFLVFPLAVGGAATGSAAVAAWSGVVYHALSHACAKSAMFLAAGGIAYALGTDNLRVLARRGDEVSQLLFAFGIATISAIGLPPSGGFVAKWQLATAAIVGGAWWWAVVVVGGGLLSAAYLGRVVRCAFVPADRAATGTPAPPRSLSPVVTIVPMALALIALGLGVLASGPLALLDASAPAALRSP